MAEAIYKIDEGSVETYQSCGKDGVEYLEFMVHSSELMAGGSPYFRDEEEIELLYSILERYFQMIAENKYQGIGLSDFERKYKNAE